MTEEIIPEGVHKDIAKCLVNTVKGRGLIEDERGNKVWPGEVPFNKVHFPENNCGGFRDFKVTCVQTKKHIEWTVSTTDREGDK